MLKVCVIIANYNHSQYLDEAIRSILAQTHTNLEIRIIDDGSDDQDVVRDIVASHNDPRIVYQELLKNTGKWNALNTAIAKTDCRLITTLDADDTCVPNRIERQVAVFHAVPDTVHVMTGFHHCWSSTELTRLTSIRVKNPQLQIIDSAMTRQLVMTGKSTPGINHYYLGKLGKDRRNSKNGDPAC